MVLVTQGYGYGYDEYSAGFRMLCRSGQGIKTCPNFNYELYVDESEFTNFVSISVNQTLSALAGFSINLGNPLGMNTNIFQPNSEIEFKASWGSRSPQTIIKGLIKKRSFTSAMKRTINISGIDYGDFLSRKRPWDVNYNPLVFNNELTSTIINRLMTLVPELILHLSKMPEEPRFSITTDPSNNNVLETIKVVLEYAGYQWFILDNKLYVFPPKELVEAQSKYNLLFGDEDEYTNIPELPNVVLHSAKVDEDFGSIKNRYKVEGNAGLYAVADDVVSIQKYKGIFEGFKKDTRLTSVQSCYLVARQMAAINGYPKTPISCSFKGTSDIRVGDVVFVGDKNGGFSMLESPYLYVMSIGQVFGNTWITTLSLGALEKRLIDII